MGWDAYAIIPWTEADEEPRTAYDWRNDRFRITSHEVAFNAAVKRAGAAILSIYEGHPPRAWVDGLLPDGGLDISDCGEALEAATGQNCWTERPWSPEFVRDLARFAEWPETLTSASISAREFLETCAEQGLGIMFSF